MSAPEETIRAGYITKPEAMLRLGKTIKRFEQLISRHRIPAVYVRQQGRRPMPTYREDDIDSLLRPVKHPVNRPAPPAARAAPAVPPVVIAAHKQLLTMKEAQALGWPRELLRELKAREHPPGIRYGKRGFKFSAKALTIEAEAVSERKWISNR